MLSLFLLMILFLPWKAEGLNEAIPPLVSALLIFMAGIVPLANVSGIIRIVAGPSLTILSTLVMAIVLERTGFFRWAAFNLLDRAHGSGILLYLYINLFCFLMTLLFNADGSILITTPIIINIVKTLRLKPHERFPFLLAGALIAIASSTLIAVSNLANLIGLKMIGLDLNSYLSMMLVPAMLGILIISLLLYCYFRRDIPKEIPDVTTLFFEGNYPEPLSGIDMSFFRVCMAIIILVRAGLFIGSGFGIPTEWIAIPGVLMLIGYTCRRKGVGPDEIALITPWYMIPFAFSIYVVVYGLHNIGLTGLLVNNLKEPLAANYLSTGLLSGGFLTIIANLFNNIPSALIGVFALTRMGLDISTMHIAYLATMIGSDIGSLILPAGTLASLMWMYILKKNDIRITWMDWFRVTVKIIPNGVIISLLTLYFWVGWLL